MLNLNHSQLHKYIYNNLMYEQHIGLLFYNNKCTTLKPLKYCSFKSKSLVQFIFHTLILPGNMKNYLYENINYETSLWKILKI